MTPIIPNVSIPNVSYFLQKYKILKFFFFLADISYTFCLIMTPIIPSLSPLFEFQLPRNISGTDFGTGYGGTVCGFHTRPSLACVDH